MEETKQVVMDRVNADVAAPPVVPLSVEALYPNGSKLPDLKVLREHLALEGRLEKPALLRLVKEAQAVFKTEPNMVVLKSPITICGDIHGQFFDLLRLFDGKVGGPPENTQYLFLGDYVDRGNFSTEVICWLYALKATYPSNFTMLRGNHECRQLTLFFNFKDEVLYKHDLEVYDAIMDSFDCLPISALLNDTFFCVHGGISPDIASLEEVKAIDRFQEPPREGPMCDLLWSDPYDEAAADGDDPDEPKKSSAPVPWFGYNDTRQCSYIYGIEAVKKFLKTNKLTSIIRAHEAQVDGYKMQMINTQSKIPRVITIFSAPNYCDIYHNKAAVLKFDNNVLNIKQFVDSPHPYYLPNFMDVFQWSLPFVAEKVTDMLATVLEHNANVPEDEPVVAEERPELARTQTNLQAKGGRLKQKVLAISRVLRLYRILRENHENIVQMKTLAGPGAKLPPGLLSEGKEGIDEALLSFVRATRGDRMNERRPSVEQLGSGDRALDLSESIKAFGSEPLDADLPQFLGQLGRQPTEVILTSEDA